MNDIEIYQMLQDIFDSVFGRRGILVTPDLTARDVIGWDSLKQFDIIMAIEDRIGLEFNGTKLEGLRSVGDLASLVKSEIARASTGS
jgi:acyl carrier protein